MLDNRVHTRLGLYFVMGLVAVSAMFLMRVSVSHPMAAGLVILVPVLLACLRRPSYLLVFSLWAAAVNVRMPGFGSLAMAYFCFAGLIGIVYLHRALLRDAREIDIGGANKILFLMGLNILLLSFVRGFGILGFGGDLAGGTAYIQWFLLIFAAVAARYVEVSRKEACCLAAGLVLFPLLNPFMEWLTIHTGGSLYFITQFFQFHVRDVVQMLQGSETVRAGTAPVAFVFQVAALVFFARKQKMLLYMLLALCGAVVLMYSGFRSRLVEYGVVTFIAGLVLLKRRSVFLLLCAVAGIAVYVYLLNAYEDLPFAVQRSVSFLPGVATDGAAMDQAQNSIAWRVQIWGMAWEELPKYLLVGRGLAWKINEWAWLNISWYQTPSYYYACHSYHSGPLTLLVDYGLLGTIAWGVFQWRVLAEIWSIRRLLMRNYSNDWLCAFYLVMAVEVSWKCFAFWAVYGQTQNMHRLILSSVAMFLIRSCLVARHEKMESLDVNCASSQQDLMEK